LAMSQRCVLCVARAGIDKLMRAAATAAAAAVRPVLVQVPCLAARVSPAACPWRVRSRPCVPSPAVGVPGLGRATILSAETSAGLPVDGRGPRPGPGPGPIYAVQFPPFPSPSPSPLSFCLSLMAARASLSLPPGGSSSSSSSSSKRTRGFSTNLTDPDPDPDPEQTKANTNKPERKRKRRLKYRRERRSPDFPTVCCALCAVLCLMFVCLSHSFPLIPIQSHSFLSFPFIPIHSHSRSYSISIVFVVCRNLRLRWVKLRT